MTSEAQTPAVRLQGLFVHPVKSTAIRPLEQASVLRRGLADDRSWIVVDGTGALVSARELPRLFTVQADTPRTDPTTRSALRLRHPLLPDHAAEIPADDPVRVDLFGRELTGIPADVETQSWLRAAVERDDVRLLWGHAPEQRRLDPAHSLPGDHTAFADSYPVTLASESSLRQLNDWIIEDALERGEDPPASMTMNRFRPNLVVTGAEPFAEDRWRRVTIGEVAFRVAKPAARCVMTTVEPGTLDKGKEPIRTLARHRRDGNKTLFAIHLVPESPGTLHLGDDVVPEV